MGCDMYIAITVRVCINICVQMVYLGGLIDRYD